VAVAVQGHLVPRGDDLGRQAGTSLDLLSDQEEGGANVRAGQHVECVRGPLRMGAVVKGEGHAARVGEPSPNAQSARHRGGDRRESRQGVGEKAAGDQVAEWHRAEIHLTLIDAAHQDADREGPQAAAAQVGQQ
jgi:hypothetical protein